TAVERLQLRPEFVDDAELESEREADGGLRREQELFDFAPHALGGQIVERHRAAQLARLGVERELEPCRKLQRAQRSQAVVGKRRRVDDAEDTPLDVAAAVERIDVLLSQRVPENR